ncbi:MAG: 2OG-Fe(II) oxygenase [Gammaproteobacteria bacterium]|nr:2OG-Fe(II) oxygenase [Gammaproteobacteria bacterium]
MEQAATNPASAPVQMDKKEAKYRLLQPNFITPEECLGLIKLVEEHGEIGDGYGGNPHPHTMTETFGGYSFEGRKRTKPKLAPGHKEALAIMLKARNLVRSHFRLPFLWLDYGHLVFREPIESGADETEDFSHPWHFDNQTDKHRTHTAILYLNEEFEGGLTRFKETDFGPYREIRPEAGKLAAFDVDKNAHGVSKLLSGKRYVLNMWFSTHWKMFRRHRRIFKHL